VNHKRVYRIMQAHSLLLARTTRSGRTSPTDGKVIVMRSNLRWCSDGFEFTCWNGEVVGALHHRRAMTARSSPGAPWRTTG
jgi:hypothetical protein